MHKNWGGIFIKYRQDMAKHICALAAKTQQILLVSNLYINKFEQSTKFFFNHLLILTRSPVTKRKRLTGKLRPRNRSLKI